MSKEEVGTSSLGKGRVGVRGAMRSGLLWPGFMRLKFMGQLWSGPCAVKEKGGAKISGGVPQSKKCPRVAVGGTEANPGAVVTTDFNVDVTDFIFTHKLSKC